MLTTIAFETPSGLCADLEQSPSAYHLALGRLAAEALRAEALLTPKPGLVDRRGSGAHADMDLAMLLASADVLEGWLTCLAEAASASLSEGWSDIALRRELGRLGRAAEVEMLAATGGVNTHRGALFSLGFLVAGAARAESHHAECVVTAAARMAQLPDVVLERKRSHGDIVRERRPRVGAAAEAASGYPTALKVALPILRSGRLRGADDHITSMNALLAVMAVLDDTCVLYRGGSEALASVRHAAAGVLTQGGVGTAEGSLELARLDEMCLRSRLSPGGAADVLSSAMFLDMLTGNDSIGGCGADPYV
jgi:triphosphoribosyl-dephospho-CoA synthase